MFRIWEGMEAKPNGLVALNQIQLRNVGFRVPDNHTASRGDAIAMRDRNAFESCSKPLILCGVRIVIAKLQRAIARHALEMRWDATTLWAAPLDHAGEVTSTGSVQDEGLPLNCT